MDPVALAQALIRCESVTPADAGALPLLAEVLTRHGFACELLRFEAPDTAPILNLWASAGEGAPHFCFAGHSDVVPVADRAAWRTDPFAASISGDQLIGRGAVDMKGAIASFVAAAIAFREARPAGTISLMITGDEEGPSVNGTVKLLDWLAARGIRPDCCLVGEPTSVEQVADTIKIGRRGSLNATVTAHGVAGHTAYPSRADNAAHRLIAMLTALTAAPLDEGTAHFEPSSLQISTIDVGNPATNVIPATATAVFNIRFNDAWTSATIETWLRDRLDAVGGRYTLTIKVSGESFLIPPADFARLVADSIQSVTGYQPQFSTGGGTSDARFIHRYCPVAELGLVGQTMHKQDEAVGVADLHRLTAIYRAVLERFFLERTKARS